MQIGYEAIVRHVPDTVKKRADFEYLRPFVPDFEEFPEEIRRLSQKDAAEQMGVTVARQALDAADLRPQDVDLMIVNCIGGQYITPGLASHIHAELGFRIDTPCWNVQEVCGSFLDASYIAANTMRADADYRRALVIAVAAWDTGTWGVDHSTPAAAVCGDGAAAAIVSKENLLCEFMSYVNRTHSEIYHDLIVDHRGPENPDLMAGLGCAGNEAVMVVSPHFFEWMMTVGRTLAPNLIGGVMDKAGVGPEDIAYVVPHQASRYALNAWQEELQNSHGISSDKWRHTWDKYGNAGAVDVAINLAEFADSGEPQHGDIIAFFSPGGAGHSPTMLLQWQ